MKQARFGLGCILVTQNPVDVDYKGLANAGTWFIGKMQTERDKDRVLHGLQDAISNAGGKGGRTDFSALINRLDSRVPDAQRTRRGPDRLLHALGDELFARPVDARRCGR